MSTAVLISGQMRTFARCYPTQRWQVYRHYHATTESELSKSLDKHYEKHNAPPRAINFVTGQLQPEPHFFVSCVDDENADSAELLRQHYANVHIEKWTDPTDLPEIPIEYGAYAPYANAAGHRQLMLQHWGNKRVWEFFGREAPRRREKALNQLGEEVAIAEFNEPAFDTIIRTRADNFFHRFIPPNPPSFGPFVCLGFPADIASTPWWGKFGGINDRFAVMGAAAAAEYFNTYDKIESLLKRGCPFHPETLVAESMREAGITIHSDLLASFSTLRTGGQQRWPEVTSEDLAELIANQ